MEGQANDLKKSSSYDSNKRKSVDKLSGASRRKMAKETSLKVDASKCLKLTSFMTKLPVVQSVEVPDENKPVSEDQYPTTSASTQPTESEISTAPVLQHSKPADQEFEAVAETQLAADFIQEPLLPQSEFPTDPGLYTNTSLSTRLIRKLCEIGACQPGLKEQFQFQKDEFGRKFQISWYTKSFGKGCLKEERNWLVYSPTNQKMYCHACWLFAESKSENYSKEWSDPDSGVVNWKKGIEKIIKHETSNQHQNAMRQYLLAKYSISNDRTVVPGLISQERRRVEKNREVLKRMIDVTLFLAKQGLPFRGHREHSCLSDGSSKSTGNFRELLSLLAKYDSTLDNHLKFEKRNELYLSHDVQNDVIQSLASELSLTIDNEVKSAQFFSLIIDSTIDISRIDQMSVSLRSVLKSGHVVERFIGFFTLENSNATAFTEIILTELQKRNIDITLCRGQAYDGASVMSGIKSGLQTRIKTLSPNAIYVHCCAHALNLVTIEAMSVNSDVQLFFGTAEKLYTFLTSSLPRLHTLKEHQKSQYESTADTLKRLSNTRWASRKHAVDAVVGSFSTILATLEDINLGQSKQHKGSVRAEAMGLSVLIRKYSFVFLMLFLQKLLDTIFVLSNYLQRKDIDIAFAQQLIDVARKKFVDMRTDEAFESLKITVNSFLNEHCSELDVETEFKEKRISRKKRMADELSRDEKVDDPTTRFKCETYFTVLDTLVTQTDERFNDFRNTVTYFRSLDPSHISEENRDSFRRLCEIYKNDINIEEANVEYDTFKNVYASIRPSLSSELQLKEVLPFLIEKQMAPGLPNLSILYKIYLTLPVTSATAERSFSRLKLIKNYLRSTMTNERLSALALLSIERDLAENIDFESTINRFASMKSRRKQFK